MDWRHVETVMVDLFRAEGMKPAKSEVAIAGEPDDRGDWVVDIFDPDGCGGQSFVERINVSNLARGLAEALERRGAKIAERAA